LVRVASPLSMPTNCATRLLKRLIPNYKNESCAE
jgi:hypothetical protein